MIALIAVLLAWPFTGEVPDDQVVARAGAIEITAGRLRAYAEAHPDRSPRALAQELVEFELLAAEAARRGLAADPGVREEVSPALVIQYLKRHFEVSWTPDKLPESLVKQSYERNRSFFVHPDLVTADHLLLTREGRRPPDLALEPLALALMGEVRRSLEADPPADGAAFVARAEAFAERAKLLGLEIRGERLGRFAQVGAFDPDFTAQAFQLQQPGALTPVFATRFGWHIARLDTREAAVHRTLEDAAPELRARILPEVRELKLKELGDELGRAYGVELDLRPIEQQSVPE